MRTPTTSATQFCAQSFVLGPDTPKTSRSERNGLTLKPSVAPCSSIRVRPVRREAQRSLRFGTPSRPCERLPTRKKKDVASIFAFGSRPSPTLSPYCLVHTNSAFCDKTFVGPNFCILVTNSLPLAFVESTAHAQTLDLPDSDHCEAKWTGLSLTRRLLTPSAHKATSY